MKKLSEGDLYCGSFDSTVTKESKQRHKNYVKKINSLKGKTIEKVYLNKRPDGNGNYYYTPVIKLSNGKFIRFTTHEVNDGFDYGTKIIYPAQEQNY